MKTDLVLTMDEYFDQCCIATKRLGPPAPDARHILITAEGDLHPGTETHGCRCDRWGHPCPGCLECKLRTHTASPDLSSTKQMR